MSSSTAVALLLFMTVLTANPAQATDLFAYALEPLQPPHTAAIASLRGKPVVMMVFEPDCVFCARQVRILNKLLADCPNLQAVAVGVRGSRQRLQQYAESMRMEFPAYAADVEFLHALDGVEVTPVLLVADAAGNFVFPMLGLQDRESLQSQIESQLGPQAGTCAHRDED